MQFTLADFKAFAASKPADEPFNPYDGGKCALGQFAKACFPDKTLTAGWSAVRIYERGFDSPCDTTVLKEAPWNMGDIILGNDAPIFLEKLWTWGALSERLQAL